MKVFSRSVDRAQVPYGTSQARGESVRIPRPTRTTAPAAAVYLQRTAGNRATAALLGGQQAPTAQALQVARSPASDLVDRHSGWGNLDEEALGKELAAGLPGNADLVEDVISEVGRNSDDVTMAIVEPLSDDELTAKLGPHPGLAQRMVIALQFGWTSGDEANVIERLIRASSPTHDRLASEPWNASPAVGGAVAAVGGEIQSNKGGHGDLILDEYSVVLETMPPGLTPEAYLQEMSADINKAVHSDAFDSVNTFKRRPQAGNAEGPAVGDIYSINIAGPDNGSVVLAESAADHFVFQTVRTGEDGWHPEYGAREFGFERRGPDGAVEWYTKGASRGGKLPGTGVVGRHMQKYGWSALIRGIAAELTSRGGTERPGSFWTSDSHREDLGTSGRLIP